jgi:hypothetical protein
MIEESVRLRRTLRGLGLFAGVIVVSEREAEKWARRAARPRVRRQQLLRDRTRCGARSAVLGAATAPPIPTLLYTIEKPRLERAWQATSI